MEINAGLYLRKNKRSFYISFFTLSFVLVFPLFFNFGEEARASGQAQHDYPGTEHTMPYKKEKPPMHPSVQDIK